MRRSSVDLPEPDLPKRPTICPSRSSRFMPSSTSSSAPSGLGNALRTSLHCNKGELFMPFVPLGHSILALGIELQGSPKEPIDHHDKQTHRADSQHDAMKISRRRRLRNIRAQAPCL